MRSLAAKLTLSFLAIGVLGAGLVVVVTNARMRQQFDDFLGAQYEEALVGQLTAYYSARGSWEGVDRLIGGTPDLAIYTPFLTLLDAEGRVVLRAPGSPLPDAGLDGSAFSRTALTSGGEPVGTLLLPTAETVLDNEGRPLPEIRFLQEMTVAALLSAVLAGLVALGAGYLLARALTRPIRDLTAATQRMAVGALGTQVTAQSGDEIGQLTHAFNTMSRDLALARDRRKQMTADIAHDLRTPLSILRGYLEGLKEGDLHGDPRLYTIMYEEVDQLEHLVGDLRTLSLVDAGELTLRHRPVDVQALLERSALAYIRQAEDRGLRLRIEAADDLPALSADPDRLTQVLNNLVSNALHHTQAGEIVLSAAYEHGDMVLRVRDSGAGIAPEDLPHVFDRFYRGDRSRKRDEQGTSGLGLAIARAIVEAHGGTISVASQPGAGSTFTVRFPPASQTHKE